MPKRTDIRTILLIGSGPIVIGQGCEFDYSGTQACKALRSEGYRIILVNSNPATIMTDPELADRTYIEPITPEAVRKILHKQREMGDPVHAVLPTLGGQTALNCACKLWDDGVLRAFDVEMIGANREVIHRAEDREIFKQIVEGLGLKMPRAKTVKTLEEAEEFVKEIGLPAIIRPAFTLGGTGGGIAYNLDEFRDIITRGLRASMIGQVLIDQSVIGWKEYELEVVRDKKDNCIIVCGIENIDPMGVHTGDSITVAPIQTLSDKEYQAMRDAAMAIMRAVGVETGGSNVQFAVNPGPKDGKFEMIVVEMNPRVSRSSALASKATGFPIAKIAAKLAVGYTLDELRNDITGSTSACFEPSIDYVVTKIPRWTFEKFPEADETLTTQMKSVGEAMAIGRTLAESLQKCIRSMEVKRFGLGLDRNDKWLLSRLGRSALRADHRGGSDLRAEMVGSEGLREPGNHGPEVRGTQENHGPTQEMVGSESRPTQTEMVGSEGRPTQTAADNQPIEWPIQEEKLRRKLAVPSQGRLYYIRYAMKMGMSVQEVHALTRIDPFFLEAIRTLVNFEDELCGVGSLEDVSAGLMTRAKQLGYSDSQLAMLYLGQNNPEAVLRVRARRKALGVNPVYKVVDTCAAEFAAITPYYYSTYEAPFAVDGVVTTDDEVRLTEKKKVVIIGGGPNRIGQGIEFDYCCVHAAFAAREMGLESVMINSNPETVSTDYDTSDMLFFEPLTLEDVLNVVERVNGEALVPAGVGNPAADRLGEPIYPDRLGEPMYPGRSALRADHGLVLGCVVQFGGQTPLNLAHGLRLGGAPIIGTSVDSIDLAEDRKRFDALLDSLGLRKPPSGTARTLAQAVDIASRIGYPVLVRPSYVLGGRGMEVCSDEQSLVNYMTSAVRISEVDDAPVLIDRFLGDATEVDCDVVADYDPFREVADPAQSVRQALISGVMEHIEQAGVHSGDSACSIPPFALGAEVTAEVQRIGRLLAKHLRVRGLMNLQLAVKDGQVFILEVNPRASRTVPFVCKATGTPWARIAAKVMMGASLAELGATEDTWRGFYAIKESVFPFGKFPGVDVVLGPEMRSTGEVMGIDVSLPIAFAKAQMGAGIFLPKQGAVFLSVRAHDRPACVEVVRGLGAMGFVVYTSPGTGKYLAERGHETRILPKIADAVRPNVLDMMSNGQLHLIINTPTKTGWKTDEGRIRAAAVRYGIPVISTMTAALATVKAIAALRSGDWGVAALQDYGQFKPVVHTNALGAFSTV